MANRVGALFRMTPGEYRANLDGLNLFFGAVLGVVMASTDQLAARDFTVMLIITAGLVVALLYVSSGRYRLIYAAVAALLLLLLPRFLGRALNDPTGIPEHLQPTLLVWLGFIVIVEFAPRERPGPAVGHEESESRARNVR